MSTLVPDMEYRGAGRSECCKQVRDTPNGVWIVTPLACRLPFVEGTLHVNHDQCRTRRWKFIHARIITKGQGETANEHNIHRETEGDIQTETPRAGAFV